MYYLDPLYGKREIDDKHLKLYQTDTLTRLRDISLSVVPSISTPSGMVTSRFEHSMGVSYLSSLLTKKDKFSEIGINLELAGLFHDAGSPPFSHASEVFLEEMTGKDHEEYAEYVFQDKEVKSAIEAVGGNIDIVFKLITGQLKPWSDLINGTIDIDNIDNSLRWSMGVGVLRSKIYEPEELIHAYGMNDEGLYLKLEYQAEIQKWELCRRLTYNHIYSDENIGPGSLLNRALQFAYEAGNLSEDFFKLTESQALYTLQNRSNPATKQLINDLTHWIFYTKAVDLGFMNASDTLIAFCENWKERFKLADIVADSLAIPREAVTVFAGKDKGFRKIHLPFIGKQKQTEEHQPLQKKHWRVKVFIHPRFAERIDEVQEIVESVVC